jgi:hypothetical protein
MPHTLSIIDKHIHAVGSVIRFKAKTGRQAYTGLTHFSLGTDLSNRAVHYRALSAHVTATVLNRELFVYPDDPLSVRELSVYIVRRNRAHGPVCE